VHTSFLRPNVLDVINWASSQYSKVTLDTSHFVAVVITDEKLLNSFKHFKERKWPPNQHDVWKKQRTTQNFDIQPSITLSQSRQPVAITPDNDAEFEEILQLSQILK